MGNQVDVLSSDGKATGSVELPDELFGADVSEYALYRAVVTYEANQRQGTVGVKTRSEVSRTSKKHHRQKGTGWARRGSLRSPVVRGGGVAFGPQARSYSSKLPKSLKRLAFCSALTVKGQSGGVKVVDDFDFETPSTKSFKQVLTACGVSDGKILFVTTDNAPVLYRSCRNLPAVKMTPVSQLGTYDLVAADTVVFMRGALDLLETRAPKAAQEETAGVAEEQAAVEPEASEPAVEEQEPVTAQEETVVEEQETAEPAAEAAADTSAESEDEPRSTDS